MYDIIKKQQSILYILTKRRNTEMPKVIFPPFNEKYVRSTARSAEEKSLLHIYGAGIVYPDVRYEFSKVSDAYLFEYVVSGKGFAETEKTGYTEVSQGDCIISAKGKHMHYGADKKNPYVKLWFGVTGDLIKPIFDTCLGKEVDYLVKKVNVYHLFEKMLAELEGNPCDNIVVLSSIILEILLAFSGKSVPEPYENTVSRALSIKQYIDTFLLDNISVERAAEHIGVTERIAVRVFKEEYGITPSKYIKKKRLERARELLENTDKTVTDIAHILCYCDQSYFSSDFKREFDVYPSEYRALYKVGRLKKASENL